MHQCKFDRQSTKSCVNSVQPSVEHSNCMTLSKSYTTTTTKKKKKKKCSICAPNQLLRSFSVVAFRLDTTVLAHVFKKTLKDRYTSYLSLSVIAPDHSCTNESTSLSLNDLKRRRAYITNPLLQPYKVEPGFTQMFPDSRSPTFFSISV